MPSKEVPVLPDFGPKGNFLYCPTHTVLAALDRSGIPPEARMVDALYLNQGSPFAVGVFDATAERAKDHFGVIRGVDQLKAIYQTFLASSQVTDQPLPVLTGIESVTFHQTAVPGGIFNVFIQPSVGPDGQIIIKGCVACGETVFTEAILKAADADVIMRVPKLAIPDECQAVSKEAVSDALSSVGYGDSKKRVKEIYIDPNEPHAIAVVRNPNEMGYDPMEIIEAMAQSLLLLYKFRGQVKPGCLPLFTGIRDVAIYSADINGPDILIDIRALPAEGRSFSGDGKAQDNESVLVTGNVSGLIVMGKILERLKEASRQDQAKVVPFFPLSA